VKAVPEVQIKDIKADVTLVGGEAVFQRRAAALLGGPVRT
jgi:hypothetical protein